MGFIVSSILFFQVGFGSQDKVDMLPYSESPWECIVPHHPGVFPLKASRSSKSHSSIRTCFVCKIGWAEVFGMKKNRPCHTVKSEVAMNLEAVASSHFAFSTLKKNMRISFHIEKIGTSEMIISGFNARENAGRLYLDLNGCTGLHPTRQSWWNRRYCWTDREHR